MPCLSSGWNAFALVGVLCLGCGDTAGGGHGDAGPKRSDAGGGAHGKLDASLDGSDDDDAAKPRACVDDTDCDDGLFCNGSEHCLPSFPTTLPRSCVHGAAPSCDDGVACTKDRCVEAKKSCVFTPSDHDGDRDPDAKCLGADGVALGRDCNDQNPQISVFVTEVCDGVDNDCDGLVDEGVSLLQYRDHDHDGRGDAQATGVNRCAGTPGYSVYNDDCDDNDDKVTPNKLEVCDGLDNDCNHQIDDGITCP